MEKTLEKLKKSLIPIYGKGESDAIIRLIFHYLKGWSLTDILIHKNDELSPFIIQEIDNILLRLLNHEPIQYIIGEARFHGLNFKIRPGVLIPRPETAELVDLILDDYKDQPDLKILDICSGSGCIAIALARSLPFSNVTALELVPVAVEQLKENALYLKTKIKILQEDIFKWYPIEKYDIIVSNPPYIMTKEAFEMDKNVMDFEPHEALFVSDESPLEFYDRISNIALNALSEKGKLYFEINPLNSEKLKVLIKNKGFNKVEIIKDFFGKDRFMICQKN